MGIREIYGKSASYPIPMGVENLTPKELPRASLRVIIFLLLIVDYLAGEYLYVFGAHKAINSLGGSFPEHTLRMAWAPFANIIKASLYFPKPLLKNTEIHLAKFGSLRRA